MKSWQEWVTENLGLGKDALGIGKILLQNQFTLAQIREMMGAKYPEFLEQQANSEEAPAPSRNPDDEAAFRRKCTGILEIQRDLARLNPKSTMIERRSGVSGNEFLEKYYSTNRPSDSLRSDDLMAGAQ